MNEKIIRKIFPKKNCLNMNKLKYDNEGLYSISYPNLAEILSKEIKIFDNEDFKLDNIVDATAGIGGNVLSFAKYFSKVYAVELDKTRFEHLENNVSNYSYDNIKCINGDSIEIIKNGLEKFDSNPDVIFFDPPWGGPSYKYIKDVELELSNYKLLDIIELIFNLKKVKFVVFKIPFNYNFLDLVNRCNEKNLIKQFNFIKEKNIVFVFLKINI
tara:strand:+ start:1198 stop:1839 length:642 start_codon:yes stop_codon:yes gene_type:complete